MLSLHTRLLQRPPRLFSPRLHLALLVEGEHREVVAMAVVVELAIVGGGVRRCLRGRALASNRPRAADAHNDPKVVRASLCRTELWRRPIHFAKDFARGRHPLHRPRDGILREAEVLQRHVQRVVEVLGCILVHNAHRDAALPQQDCYLCLGAREAMARRVKAVLPEGANHLVRYRPAGALQDRFRAPRQLVAKLGRLQHAEIGGRR
mmetsp:Transcript_18796/g.61997  ORF Transcript_18796/g.61997 Transcript_18796/m.61997 type:complete len:207 (-) Transcript_18796:27-647(-)